MVADWEAKTVTDGEAATLTLRANLVMSLTYEQLSLSAFPCLALQSAVVNLIGFEEDDAAIGRQRIQGQCEPCPLLVRERLANAAPDIAA